MSEDFSFSPIDDDYILRDDYTSHLELGDSIKELIKEYVREILKDKEFIKTIIDKGEKE